MACYEHTVIIRQDLSEKQQNDVIDKYQNIIYKNEGKLINRISTGFNLLSAI